MTLSFCGMEVNKTFSFISGLNENALNIVLTAHISEEKIEFLDLTLSLSDNRIITALQTNSDE